MARKITNSGLLTALTSGRLSKFISLLAADDKIDIQIRDNYLSIYYRGSSLLKISGVNSFQFDKNYFCLPSADAINLESIKLIDLVKQESYPQFIAQAKSLIDKWLKIHPKPEREEQHRLILENQFSASDYTIIDIEFEVSANSDYHCTFTPEGKSRPKKPRFDIIVVNKHGRLCVIELKKGLKALTGTSGLKEHLECYNHSIGRCPNYFCGEMKELLTQKQELGLADKRLAISNERPEFIFAYSFDDKSEDEEQLRVFRKEAADAQNDIKCLIIKRNSLKLLES